MKRFLFRLGVFAIIMFACDVSIGFIGNYFVANAKGGETSRKIHIGLKTDEDILIFGSSRAINHYNPNVFEDTLGMSTYNCGFGGYGIITAYGYLKMVEKRYHPKIIIYEVTPIFDLLEGDNHSFIGPLRYFYDEEGVDSIFWSVDKTERIKMLSGMYRYNSSLPQLIMDNIHPLHNDNKGYRPLGETGMVHEPKNREHRRYQYDSLKLYYLEKIISDCMGDITLVFVVSPLYKNTNDDVLKPIKTLCNKYDVTFISHYVDSSFNNRVDYFKDSGHLNQIGSMEYSKKVAKEIKQVILGK